MSIKINLWATNKPRAILVLIITILFVFYWIHEISSLKTASYLVDRNKTCSIKNVRLLSRAYWTYGGKNSSGPKGIVFEDITRKTFTIDGKVFSSLKNRSALFDTLQYYSLLMTILTNKQGCRDYYSHTNDKQIEVLGLAVEQKEFIPLELVDKEARKQTKESLIIAPILYLVLLLLIFGSKKEKD